MRLLALLGLLVACSPAAPSERPNVLLVVLDTTRADLLSAYDHPAPTSPHLEKLAREGALLTRAYSTDFWTLPSHASLLTGLYPSEHGATSETNRLGPGVETLAEHLAGAGYSTAGFVSNPWISRETGFAQGFGSFTETWREAGQPPDRQAVERAGRFIANEARARRPFFVFVNLNDAHMPYSPDPQVLHEVAPRAHSVERTRRLKRLVGTWEYLAGAVVLDATDLDILRDLYQGELRTVDGHLGELVAALTAAGVLNDTLVIVTADHGENLGEHGLIDHMLSMYDTTIRVPLVIRFPSRVEAGRVVPEVASLVDVLPTILDAVGIEPPAGAGRSLLGDTPAAPRGFVIAENERPHNGIRLLETGFPEFDTSKIDGRMRMLRTDRYKLIWSEGRVELYDLEADPGEQRDLGAEMPQLRDELLGELEAWMAASKTRSGAAAAPGPVDPRAREQLRALGYVE